MKDTAVRALLEELPDLVAKGVLSPEAAERLRLHYAAQIEEAGAWGRRATVLVLGVIGALLVGAGIILVLAHNWDELSRPVRAGLSIGLLVGAQALAGWSMLRRRESPAWAESSASLLALAVGACIALVSQTYHIAGDTADFFLTWTILALPLMYLLDSRAAGILTWAGITTWAGWASWAVFRSEGKGLLALLIAAAIPYLIFAARRHGREVRTALLFWVVALVLPLISALALEEAHSSVWIPFYAGLFAAMFALGAGGETDAFRRPLGGELRGGHERLRTPGRPSSDTEAWRTPLRLVGYVGIVVLSLVLTFHDPWNDAARDSLKDPTLRGDLGDLLFALGAGVLALVFAGRWARAGRWHLAAAAAIPLPAFGLWLAAVQLGGGSDVVCVVVFDLYLLILGVLTLAYGLTDGRIGVTNLGLLTVAVLVVARFFDTDWSFLARGVIFIVLGLGFLAANLRLLSQRRKGERVPAGGIS